MLNKSKDYSIGFALNFNTIYQLYIPKAYIIEYHNGILKSLIKQVNQTIIQDFDFDILPNEIDELIKICETFSSEALIKKFKITKQNTFENLLQNTLLNKQFKNYLSNKLKLFLDKIIITNSPLTIDFKRENWFSINQINYTNHLVEPILIFEKHEDNSVSYTLELEINQKKTIPCKSKIIIFAPELSFIILNQELFQINGLNSNKIKPFLNQSSIEIEAKNANLYFDKFVKEVSNAVNIQAKGFDFQHYNEILNCKIQLINHFITNRYFIEIIFEYHNITFKHQDKKQTFSKISFDENNQIFVAKTTRNLVEEAKIVEKLLNFDFFKNDFNYYEWKKDSKKYHLIEYIVRNYDNFKNIGIEPDLKINHKKLIAKIPEYQLSTSKKNDWFDVEIKIDCGDFSFSFSKLIPYLIKNERFYLLPDDTVFVIPEEWFSKFDLLIKQGKINDNLIKLPKSNFSILENLAPEIILFEEKIHSQLNLDFLKATLRPYQLQGVKWLKNNCESTFGSCLADDMGLGKTLQIIALLVHYKTTLDFEKPVSYSLFDQEDTKQKPLNALIVLPSSLIFNWKNEIKKFAPHLTVFQYIGNDRKTFESQMTQYDVILTTYGLVLKDIEMLKKKTFQFLILDESHRIKNVNSKIFKEINSLMIPYKISLSGTPVENSLAELWAQMQFINPNILGGFNYFKENFIEPITKKQNIVTLESLKKIIEPFILRRTKTQVAPELPAKIDQIHYCEMLPNQEKRYQEEVSKARNLLLKIDKPINKINVFNTLLLLRQISNHSKLINESFESGKEYEVQTHLETLIKSNQKVLIFSSFVQHLKIYTTWCDSHQYKYSLLTGSVPMQEREKIVSNFMQDDSISLFFISKKAGGEGLNLTVANYVVLLDPWWNPFVEEQAIARSHRIGQTSNVLITRFITQNSIEEKILKLQLQKQELFNQLIQESDIQEVMFNHLEELL